MSIANFGQNLIKSGDFVGHLTCVNALRRIHYFLSPQYSIHISNRKISLIHEFLIIIYLQPSLNILGWLFLKILAQWQIGELGTFDYR